MGVVHFVLLGGSPGAATVGISYCVKNYQKWKREKREILESVVVVSTKEVFEGTLYAGGTAILNAYGTDRKKKELNLKPYETVKSFIERQFGSLISQNRGTFDICEVRVDDFRFSVISLARKLLQYKNKEIWLNITGGMNTMTIQALVTTYFGGVVAKIYYTYVPQKYNQYLQPVTENEGEKFQFIEIPVIKIEFDENYFLTLDTIKENGGEIETKELISRLKQKGFQISTQYLLKMRGHGVIQDDRESGLTKLTKLGSDMLSLYGDAEFKKYVTTLSAAE